MPDVSENDIWNYDIGMPFAHHTHLAPKVKASLYAHLNSDIVNWNATIEDVLFMNGNDNQLTF